MPEEILFPSQQPNEKIILVVREHWFPLSIKLGVLFILIFIPLIVNYFVGGSNLFNFSGIVSDLLSLAAQIYYLGLIIAIFVIWVLYYLNVHIVSEKRVVDIDQNGLLKRQASELNLETIEDVTSEKSGFFGNIFDYGNVFIQTAGATERFEFNNVPKPEKITNIVLALYEQRIKNIKD